ncbi:MAG: hypothetical protein O7B35_09455 [Deltaproteobacteria bacterium]|nr:hypothetical protein [Deltaproteobacteria bacterium]
MIKMSWLTLLISVSFGLGMVEGVAHAQQASALVLEKNGVTVPDIQPYFEIPVGKTISLSPGARLVFQHYYTCRTVTVVGGEIKFGAEIYTITGGNKEKDIRTPCPRTVSLKVGVESGGILMRGFSTVILPARPAFVLIGRRAGDFSSLRVSNKGNVVLEVLLKGRRFNWPDNMDPLAEGANYELTLHTTTAGHKPVAMKFIVSAQEGSRVAEGTILVRVD